MKHYIIVKYNELATDQDALYQEIAALFEGAKAIDGVRGVALHRSAVDLPNRHDLMIQLDLKEGALEHWNKSEVHHVWKRDYAKYVALKTIFDRE